MFAWKDELEAFLRISLYFISIYYLYGNFLFPPANFTRKLPGDITVPEPNLCYIIYELRVVAVILTIITFLESVVLSFALTSGGRIFLDDTMFSQYSFHTSLGEYIGFAFIIGGGLLRRYCGRELGDLFTWTVTIRTGVGHKIVQTRIYKYLRHPSYTGILLIASGVPLVYVNSAVQQAVDTWAPSEWWSVGWWAYCFGQALVLVMMRIPTEERILEEEFGEEYTDYMRRTWRLLPLLY